MRNARLPKTQQSSKIPTGGRNLWQSQGDTGLEGQKEVSVKQWCRFTHEPAKPTNCKCAPRLEGERKEKGGYFQDNGNIIISARKGTGVLFEFYWG